MTERTKQNELAKYSVEEAAADILLKIKEAWNSPIVLRKDIAKFSQGLVTVKSMGTLDDRGRGIQSAIKINGKIAYTKDSVIEWLASRIARHAEKPERRGGKRKCKNDALLER
jgi:hypothetical protein